MTIYLTQGGDDGARADEIEDKLRSAIPDLKRDSNSGRHRSRIGRQRERSIVVLVATPRRRHQRRQSDRRTSGVIRAMYSSSSSAATFPLGTTSGSFNPETPTGSPRPDCRTKFSTLSRASARPTKTMSRSDRPSWSRSRRARGESAIRRSLSKPLSISSRTSRRKAPRSRSSILISSRATCATISTSRPSFSLTRSSPRRSVSTTSS